MPKRIAPRIITTLITLGLLVFAASVFLKDVSRAQENQESSNERTIEDKIPKGLPIKVKLKEEKSSRVKSLSNEGWMRDLQFELTNTSTKPIYYVALWTDMPDVISEAGIKFVFPIRYGRVEFIDARTLPTKDDTPIPPGKTVTIALTENYAKAWEARIARGGKQPHKLEFKFVHLSFGDGTGFDGTGTFFPSRTSSSICPEQGDPPTFTFYRTTKIPAIVPVSFFSTPNF